LKIVITEGGVTWLPPLMWRLDSEYKGLRSEIPWVRKKPSEYLSEHVRITTQPMERPEQEGLLLEVLDMMDYQHMLMYSSDYPDEHFVSPDELPPFSLEVKRKILSDNARQLYRI
jgi:predicted TIM-barrel fold metal-dependent hydrolase